MNLHMVRVCVIACGLCFAVGQSEELPKPKGSVCWPLHFAGITVGSTTDSQVQRLFGRGIFRADEGHTGGRYFLDSKRTSTLHVVEGVDRVVDELTVRSGIDPTIKGAERELAVSKWFDPQEGFGNWHALHLGSSMKDVLDNLGEPQKRLRGDKWLYETTCACELPAYLTVAFKGGRVIELGLSEEE